MIRRQANCASTCANQSSGSAGQKGGSFRETAATLGAEAPSDAEGGVGSWLPEAEPEADRMPSRAGLSSVDMAWMSRRGHQL